MVHFSEEIGEEFFPVPMDAFLIKLLIVLTTAVAVGGTTYVVLTIFEVLRGEDER